MNRVKLFAAIGVAGLLWQPQALWACAACYGQSDSPLAQGLNWGIFSLLAVVVLVLSSVASFFVYLGKRSAKSTEAAGSESWPQPVRRD